MKEFELIAVCSFGVESVLARELVGLGYRDLEKENGRVFFSGTYRDIARCNILLRTADRILVKMASYRALDFEELFQGALAVRWHDIIPENGIMHVSGKSVRSALYSVPDCQAIVKKAIIESMKRKYRRDTFDENGPLYRIEVSILKDEASLTLDTSGNGLHKRGYRPSAGPAPLRETLAAAIILLSGWKAERLLADPFCGSGTIPIEAAMIGRGIAPGMSREFVSMGWPSFPSADWNSAREEAAAAVKKAEFKILASDIDIRAVRTGMRNALAAGVADNIVFQKKPVSEFSSSLPGGFMISNPPYGKRMGSSEGLPAVYKDIGRLIQSLDTWRFLILSGDEHFARHTGARADKNRKLYNGKIKAYLHQYFEKA